MCPHCKTKCSFFGKGANHDFVLFCNGCDKGVYFQMPDSRCFPDEYQHTIPIEIDDIVDYYPKNVPYVDQAIPKDVADDYLEAIKCRGVLASKAVVTQCRRALQNACTLNGAPNSDLINQIDDLYNRRIINPTLKDVAHTIRMIGNWGAHPQKDPLKEVAPSDADEVLQFTDEFLDEVFVRPMRIKNFKAKKGIT